MFCSSLPVPYEASKDCQFKIETGFDLGGAKGRRPPDLLHAICLQQRRQRVFRQAKGVLLWTGLRT